jgi:peptidoglycan hydrolase-like protein with peptidoglycan-binding domain
MASAIALAAPQPALAASADVAALQVALRALGLAPGPIDGISGPLTQRAVRRFQARAHLVVDGIAGPHTRRALGRRGRPRLGSRLMRIGQRGWDVAALQFLLSSRGYGPGGFDGGFGPKTALAVRRFQRAAGLAVDGVAGPATLGALRHRQLYVAPSGPVRFLRPIGGRITDGFGWVGGRRHTGVDIPARAGTPVGAAGRGVVAFAGWNDGGYGYLVVVRHRLGFESWYAHLSRIAVSVGQVVVGGSRIGYVGSTGRSTGPHLHFEIRYHEAFIDPCSEYDCSGHGIGAKLVSTRLVESDIAPVAGYDEPQRRGPF